MMTDLWWCRRRGEDAERGSSAVGLVILTPMMAMLLFFVVAAGRLGVIESKLTSAARSAARAASQTQSVSTAQAAATTTAEATLDHLRTGCHGGPQVRVLELDLRPGGRGAYPGLMCSEAVGSVRARLARQPNSVRRFRFSGGPVSEWGFLTVHRGAPRMIPGPDRPPRDWERGQVTVVFVVLAAVLVMLGGLAYDGARILDAKRAASSLALEAARAGAQAISTEPIYQGDGNVTVDPIASANRGG